MRLNEFRDKLQTIAFSSRLYRKFLTSPAPRALALVPTDPWPGDARQGTILIQGPMGFAPGAALDLLHSAQEQKLWRQSAHDFEWLRDLRAVGGDAARRRARMLVREWLAHFGQWQAEAWDPGATGQRIANCIGLHDFYCASADDEFRAELFSSLGRQVRHLNHVSHARLDPLSQFYAAKGMLVGALAFGEGFEAMLERGVALLGQLLPQLTETDGGNRWRNPQLQAHLTRHLIDLRALLRQAGGKAGLALLGAIDSQVSLLASALRFFRHGDGNLAVFNGGNEDRAVLIDAVLSQADSRARPRSGLTSTGYERLSGGRAVAIVDCGLPPRPGFDRLAHAAPGAFEFSYARERIFVNCGAPEFASPVTLDSADGEAKVSAWRQALAATAAHNMLTLADRNAIDVLPNGLGQGLQLTLSRTAENGGERLDLMHDAWRHSLGANARRVLWLSSCGKEFCGEETIDAKAMVPFALRFHLHPQVQAVLIKDGKAALLRLPSGGGWRIMSEHAPFTLEPSIYCANGTPYRRTQQLVIQGDCAKGQTKIAWALVRENG